MKYLVLLLFISVSTILQSQSLLVEGGGLNINTYGQLNGKLNQYSLGIIGSKGGVFGRDVKFEMKVFTEGGLMITGAYKQYFTLFQGDYSPAIAAEIEYSLINPIIPIFLGHRITFSPSIMQEITLLNRLKLIPEVGYAFSRTTGSGWDFSYDYVDNHPFISMSAAYKKVFGGDFFIKTTYRYTEERNLRYREGRNLEIGLGFIIDL